MLASSYFSGVIHRRLWFSLQVFALGQDREWLTAGMGISTSGIISNWNHLDNVGGRLSENNCSQVRLYICHEVLWVWDVWFARDKCEVPRKELLVWGDDSVHLELLLECGGFLRRRACS